MSNVPTPASTPNFTLFVDSRYTSPYALSVFVALREKALPVTLHTVDLDAGAHHAQDYAVLSTTRRVPTLVQGDFALSESSAITEYLDETFGGTALYPRDPRDRARARQVQAWLRSDLMPLRAERSTEHVFGAPNRTPLTDAGYAAANKLIAAADALLPEGANTLFDKWCLADIDLAIMLNRLVRNDDVVPARLAAYARHHWEHPAVQEWAAKPRPAL